MPRDEAAPRAIEDEEGAFAYQRLKILTEGDAPQACLEFNRALNAGGDVNYGDYVRLTPNVKPAVTAAGETLCLAGLEFNKEYSVRLRAGLPSQSGETLERPAEVTIAFGDKPAYVGFAGDGVVLPRLEADGLSFETVNVERVGIEIFRVSDRALARKTIVSGEAVPENDYYYVYGDENGEDVGAKIFTDEIDVDLIRNETVTTIVPFGAALPDLKAGAYFVRLQDLSPGADGSRKAQSWRWLLYTDLALTTFSSSEGIDIFVRSLDSGKPMANIALELIAENNDSLARASTNSDGVARFEKAAINGDYPRTPKMIMAYGPQDDFAALDLTRAPLDLSERNIGGRAASSVVDGYLYLDRGIYRAGGNGASNGAYARRHRSRGQSPYDLDHKPAQWRGGVQRSHHRFRNWRQVD